MLQTCGFYHEPTKPGSPSPPLRYPIVARSGIQSTNSSFESGRPISSVTAGCQDRYRVFFSVGEDTLISSGYGAFAWCTILAICWLSHTTVTEWGTEFQHLLGISLFSGSIGAIIGMITWPLEKWLDRTNRSQTVLERRRGSPSLSARIGSPEVRQM